MEELNKEYTRRMLELTKLDVGEYGGHVVADKLLCELLTRLGYKSVVKAYEKVFKWYA